MPEVNDIEAFVTWMFEEGIEQTMNVVKTNGDILSILMEELNNEWIASCEIADASTEEQTVNELNYFGRKNMTYYQDFSCLLEHEFATATDDEDADEKAFVPHYNNGVRLWESKDFDFELDDDDDENSGEFELAWRMVEEGESENDFIIIRKSHIRYSNGDLAFWHGYRLATTSEFQKFHGAGND